MNPLTSTLGAMSLAALAGIAMGCGGEGSAVETTTSALSGLQSFVFADYSGQIWLDQGGYLTATGLQSDSESGDVPSLVTIGTTMYIGYHGNNNSWTNNHYWFDQIGMPAVDSGGSLAEYTSPSLTALPNGSIAFAFEGVNGHLWIGLNGPFSGQDTGGAMAYNTSPVVAGLPNGLLAMAFQGGNGHLWVGMSGPKSGKDTGGAMASGTNPSIAALPNNQIAYAFQGVNGHLWFGQGNGFGGSDTGMQMQGSPSVTIDLTTGLPQVLFVFTNGHIGNWSCTANGRCSGLDLGISTWTSPRWVYSDNGSWEIVYCGTNGDLWIDSSSFGNADQGMTCDG